MRKSIFILAIFLFTIGSMWANLDKFQGKATYTGNSDYQNGEIVLSDRGVLYDQTDIGGSGGLTSSQYFDDFGGGSQAADDFVVPTGETWDIGHIFIQGGYWNGTGPTYYAHVRFFADDAGLPAATPATEFLDIPVASDNGDLYIALPSTVSLGEGTYWLSVVSHMEFGAYGQWGWQQNATITGNEFAWREPEGVFASGQTTWAYNTPSGTTPFDLCFALYDDLENPFGAECAEALPAVEGTNISSNQTQWFYYTAPGTGTVNVHSCFDGQFVDTRVYAYDSCSGSSIGDNDDSPCSFYSYASDLTIAVTEATTYYFEWTDYWDNLPFFWDLSFTSGGPVLPSVDFSVPDSPGQFEYSSNTYTELGWTDVIVLDDLTIAGWAIDYTWDTDSWPSEGSFWVESPAGIRAQAQIGAAQSDGTYNVQLPDFNGESSAGTWKIWIQDSYGDGGHQATNITMHIMFEPDLLIYPVPNSPGQFDYNSNTYTELGWTDILVIENGEIIDWMIDYTWDTDSWPSEGSFWVESPAGIRAQAQIGAAQSDGTYNVQLPDFNGESSAGTWKIWIQDSYGDGGHQATDITMTISAIITGPPAPGFVSNPLPVDGSSWVPFDTGDLTWDFGSDTETYDVKLGPAGAMVTVVSGAAYPGPSGLYTYAGLDPGTAYEWQIISKNANRLETEGPVWTFNTTCDPISDFPLIETFEFDDGGFSHDGTNDCWEYGMPTDPDLSYPGPPSGFSGDYVWGTNLAGDYPISSLCYLYTPCYDLTAAPAEMLFDFMHWDNLETGWDGVNLKINVEGSDVWELIYPLAGYPDDTVNGLDDINTNEPGFTGYINAWVRSIYDISAYVGQIVRFKFVFGSDSSVNRSGFYLDDVRLHEPSPSLELSTTFLDFGDWQVGQTGTLPLIISNPDSAPFDLEIQSLATDIPEFSIELARSDFIEPGGSLLYNVSFEPSSISDFEGIITIVSNDPFTLPPFANGATVNLAGRGVEPYSEIGSLPANVNLFIPANSTNDVDIEITNVGVAPLDLYDIEMSSRDFVVSPEEIIGIPYLESEMINCSYTASTENNIEFGLITFETNEPWLPPGEDFSNGIPADWTQIQYSGTGLWTWQGAGGTGDLIGTDGIYVQATDNSGLDLDVGLFTPSLDLSGITSMDLEFDRNFQDFAGYGEASVNTYSGGTGLANFEEQLWTKTIDDPTGGEHTILNFDPSTYTDPSDVYIEFWYTDDAYSGAWYFRIDNIALIDNSRSLIESTPRNYLIPVTAYTVEPYDVTYPDTLSGYRVLNQLAGSGTRETDVPEYNWYDIRTPGNLWSDPAALVELEHDFNYFENEITSVSIYNNTVTWWPILDMFSDARKDSKTGGNHTYIQSDIDIKEFGTPIEAELDNRFANQIYMQGIIWTGTEAYVTTDEEKTVFSFYYPELLEVQIVLFASGEVKFQWKTFDTFLWDNYPDSFWGAGLFGDGNARADYAVVYDDLEWLFPNYWPESAVGFYPGFDDTAMLPDEVEFNEDTIYYLDVSQYIPTGGDVLDIVLTDPDHLTTVVDGNMIEIHPDPDFFDEDGESIGYTISAPVRSSGTVLAKVLPVNDPPVLIAPLDDLELMEDFDPPVTVPLAGVFEDVDSDLDLTLDLSIAGKVTAELVGTDLILTSILNEYTTTPIEITITADEVIVRGQDGAKNRVSLSDSRTTGSRDMVEDSFLLTITPVNDAPVVVAPIDDTEIPEDTNAMFDLNGVFDDADGDVLTFGYQLETGSVLTADLTAGVLTLTPPANWNGSEGIIVTADDGVTRTRSDITSKITKSRDTVQDEFMLTVTPVNDVPVVVAPIADFSFPEDTVDNSIDLNAVFDDVDIPYGDLLDFSVTGNNHIAVDIVAGVVTLTPEENWNGIEILTFIATDEALATAQELVQVTITPVNDVPTIALPDEFVFDEGGTLNVNFNQYVNDIDGDPLTLSVAGNTEVSVDITNLQVLFGTVDPLFFGEETLTFTVDDGVARGRDTAADDVLVIVNYVNDPPEYVGPDYVNQLEDFGTYTIGDLDDFFTDIDPPENTNLTFEIVSFNATKINAMLDVDNNLIIESVPNAFGLSNLRVRATDNDDFETRVSQSTIQDIQIDITPVNDPPELLDLPVEIQMASNDIFNLNLDNNWSDVDDLNPVMTVTSPAGFVTVTQLAGYNYRFRLNSAGLTDVSDYITVTIDDGHDRDAVSQDILVTVTASQPPYITFLIPNLEYLEDFELTEVVDLDQCFADPEDDPLSFSVEVLTLEGEDPVIDAQIDGDNLLWLGSIIENWFGVAQIRIDCADFSDRIVVSQNVDIYVAPVNDPPVLVTELEDLVLDEDFGTYLVADLDDIFFDVDGDPLTFPSQSNNGVVNSLLIYPTHEFSILSVPDLHGMGTITVFADDGHIHPFQRPETTFMVTVNSVYDYPEFVNVPEAPVFAIDLAGETLDFSGWINDHNEVNTIPIGFELVGDIPYYEVNNTEGQLWMLDVYPIGHQWAYPDQECILTLQSPDRVVYEVTVTFTINFAPYVTNEFHDIALNVGSTYAYGNAMSYYFADPEGNSLNYELLYDHEVLNVYIAARSEYLTVQAINGDGPYDVTVVAHDEFTRASCSQTFTVDIMGQTREDQTQDQEPNDTPVFVTELGRNIPNPFNPETNIFFSLAEAGEVQLTIYNIKGEVIRNLTSQSYGEGVHSVRWDGIDESGQAVSSGVYFYKITTGSYNNMKKMILMK